MPSLKDIRRRIASVKNTQKITRAMKLVAAAKLRRAQDSILKARPYAMKLHEMISELALRAGASDHPLLSVRAPKRVMLLVLTSDRGLCGAFNANVIRAAETYRERELDRHREIRVAVVGRKGRDYFRHRGTQIERTYAGVDVDTAQERSKEIGSSIIDHFLSADLDLVYLLYNEFKSAMTQRIVVEQLLPIAPMHLAPDQGTAVDFRYEPDKRAILEAILPMYVQVEVYRATLEATASEYGARMTAMENATTNASDMVDSLTLDYNKARQAAITKELLEIVAGAEAL